MVEQCSDYNGETLVFTCAGAAHSGQVANRAGLVLTMQGAGHLYCAAAIAAERPDKLERTRNAARRVVIDGCDDDCARRILERAGMPVDLHVHVTELGIGKDADDPHIAADAKRVAEAVVSRLSS